MPVYSYRILTPSGRTRAGVIPADSARTARQALRARGAYPTEVREETPAAARRRVGAAELAAAARQIATLVAAGVPVAEALECVTVHADHPALVRALTVAGTRLAEGETLADALGASPRVFPPLFRDLVRAGEASGALPGVLLRLAEHAERTAALRARLRAALAYPAVLVGASVVVVGFLMMWVVPQVTRLFAETGTPLPLATRLLVATAGLVGATWWVALPAAAVAAWALRAWAATPAGRRRCDAVALGVPVLGRLLRAAAVARAARTLATLLAGGIPLETALGIAAPAAGNQRIADAVGAARAAVREGQALAPALAATGEMPPLVVRLAAVGERSGTLDAMLAHAADGAEAEVERALAAATTLVEPLLVVVMGAVVLALVAAILVPLFDLNALVR